MVGRGRTSGEELLFFLPLRPVLPSVVVLVARVVGVVALGAVLARLVEYSRALCRVFFLLLLYLLPVFEENTARLLDQAAPVLVLFVATLLGRTPYNTVAYLFNWQILQLEKVAAVSAVAAAVVAVVVAAVSFVVVFCCRFCCYCCLLPLFVLLLLLLPLVVLFCCCCRCFCFLLYFVVVVAAVSAVVAAVALGLLFVGNEKMLGSK